MIKGFNASFLSKLINYNDPRVESFADNLYEKVRQLGILPSFVVRDKYVRDRTDIIDKSTLPTIFKKDDRFTFGYCYKGAELGTDSEILNIEKVWSLEFELCYDNEAETRSVEFLDGFIVVDNEFNVTVGSVTFTVTNAEYLKVNKFEINRVRDSVTLKVNGVDYPAKILDSDDDTQFDTVYMIGEVTPEEVNYGLLYNWYAATDERKITSSDEYIVPSIDDFADLLLYFGGVDSRPDFPLVELYENTLRLIAETTWIHNTGTNTTGLNFKAGGFRINTGFEEKGISATYRVTDSFNESATGVLAIILYEAVEPYLGLYTSIEGQAYPKNNGNSLRVYRMATGDELLLPDGLLDSIYTGNDGRNYRLTKVNDKVWLADNLCETEYRYTAKTLTLINLGSFSGDTSGFDIETPGGQYVFTFDVVGSSDISDIYDSLAMYEPDSLTPITDFDNEYFSVVLQYNKIFIIEKQVITLITSPYFGTSAMVVGSEGREIPEVTDNAEWAAEEEGALCAYNNDWDNV